MTGQVLEVSRERVDQWLAFRQPYCQMCLLTTRHLTASMAHLQRSQRTDLR